MADRRVALSCALISALSVPLVALGVIAHDQQDPWTAALRAGEPAAVSHSVLPKLREGASQAEASAGADAASAPPSAPEARLGDAGEPAGAQAAARSDAPASAQPAHPQPADPPHLLDDNQLIVFYGSPLASGLGILGMFEPEEAAQRVQQQAQIYDEINGERGAVPALDLIYGMAMSEPTENGIYVRYLDDDVVRRYLDLAEQYDLQLILDLQIGRGAIIDEVRKIERFLRHPRVHVAIDPEYAVGPHGEPIYTPGQMSGHEMNEVQEYVSGLVREHGLPPKMLVVHQYMDHTITDGEATREVGGVDIVLNMDGFGEIREKAKKYHSYSSRPYAHRNSFNIFLKQDERVMSEREILKLAPEPDAIFYQ